MCNHASTEKGTAALTVPPTAVSGSVFFDLFSRPSLCPHLAGLLINAWQVDLGYELDGGWHVGVVVAAMDVQAVDAILVGALSPKQSVSSVADGMECSREVVPEWFRSNSTSTGRPRPLVRTNMPLTGRVSSPPQRCSNDESHLLLVLSRLFQAPQANGSFGALLRPWSFDAEVFDVD